MVASPKNGLVKIWYEVIRSDLQERKVSKYLAKDKNAWWFFIRKFLTNVSIEQGFSNQYDVDDLNLTIKQSYFKK